MAEPGFVVLGLSHRTATLAVRERASLDERQARRVLRRLVGDERLDEALVLCTCNRTELYAVATSLGAAEDALREALEAASGLAAATLACSSYLMHERMAVEHLFCVAAGLDSAVLGESEIAGQLRRAAELAQEEGALGRLLGEVQRRALAAAGRVRRETALSRGPTSLATVVAREALARQRDGSILLIGGGRLISAIAGALAGGGARRLVIATRTLADARRLAAGRDAEGATLAELGAHIRAADVIVSATKAPHALLGAEQLRASGRPVAVFDLAVPRDVDPAAATLPGVELHDLAEIQGRASLARRARMADVESAIRLIRAEVERCLRWRRDLAVSPLIDALWRHAEQLRREELSRRCAGLPEAERRRADALTAALVRKLLKGPAQRLREDGGTAQARLAGELFGLDAEPGRPALHVVDGAQRRGAA